MRRSTLTGSGAARQSMQALRAQDSNKPGLHTPQTKERPTFGKLSVSKPQSGTSERRVSFFGKRTSGPGSRNSQYGIFGTEKIKDPRPLNDKAFIQQYIRQLCEFLSENDYAFNVSMKSLQAPSVKDFLKIFTFIYRFLCPSYELPDAKFEEEVPRIFKDLGYPFAISKSSMYTVGAPHTWPQIVAALVWLIDCVKLYHAKKDNSPSFEDGQPWGGETEDGIIHNKLFLDYTVKCYEHFMTGADSFEEFDAELESKLKDLYNVDESHLESITMENKRLNIEIARLERERENEPNRLVSLKKLKTSLQADVQKYQAYMTNLESHTGILDQKVKDVSEEVAAAEMELEAIKQENAKLQHTFDNQKYSVADIERINHERNELQQTINKLTKELEAEQQQLWNEELKYARSKEGIETQLAEYHKLARKLKLIPQSAENSKGCDYEIKFNPEAGPNCLVKYRTQIYVPLKERLNQTEDEISKALHKKIGLEDTLEQVNTMVAESKRTVKMLKEEIQKLDDLYQQKIKEAEEEEKKRATELESLEKHKHLLESGVNEGLSEATNELNDIQRQYQVVLQTTTEERWKIGINVQRLLEVVATHVESVEKYLEEQILRADREFEEFMSEDSLKDLNEIIDKYKQKAAILETEEEMLTRE
ncbi:kinetochore protein NDC80 homolog [Ornithorhynchus anatinus]|uniref:Kinetochore protein NDC80 n=1 Tax=Ornithorhynchus anatinus TaxID=9258 RepID=F6QUM4_ORNAN|nr:kinetochore protein NDC80 homolog [Ornithorhynchus anatinus]XP_007664595.1 kinetochore protein NDC80 homolog [Ornithorhynchus anatinus]XP_007664596.1 kinetochore protein NDC80 homolog [Ornithorhynchus anatinus]XP_007664597.1 kinetochore protein NDC80 homolog [Ornithorhynchus anatinus]